jgi:hypothetical protein
MATSTGPKKANLTQPEMQGQGRRTARSARRSSRRSCRCRLAHRRTAATCQRDGSPEQEPDPVGLVDGAGVMAWLLFYLVLTVLVGLFYLLCQRVYPVPHRL